MIQHAFLILAHDSPNVLNALLSQLDDKRNDIFIHLDSKSKIDKNALKVTKTNIFYTESTDVRWGHYSQINATYLLLKLAASKGKYKYYHLLSGTTLCTKSQDVIYTFYDNTDLEYFHINKLTFKSIQDRCKYYYPFIGLHCFRKHKVIKGLSIVLGKLQILVGINRLRHNPLTPLYNGMEWFSITDDFVRYVISQEPLVKKTFNHTLAGEEVFIQSLAMHSDFKSRVYGYNGKDNHVDASKTYQFWNNGKSTEVDTIDKCNKVIKDNTSFFARKFSNNNQEVLTYILKKTHS